MHGTQQDGPRSILQTLRPVKPDTFDGVRNSRKVEAWLYTVEKYCELVQMTDERQRVFFAVALLPRWCCYMVASTGIRSKCGYSSRLGSFL